MGPRRDDERPPGIGPDPAVAWSAAGAPPRPDVERFRAPERFRAVEHPATGLAAADAGATDHRGAVVLAAPGVHAPAVSPVPAAGPAFVAALPAAAVPGHRAVRPAAGHRVQPVGLPAGRSVRAARRVRLTRAVWAAARSIRSIRPARPAWAAR